jgi:hypothetical protein
MKANIPKRDLKQVQAAQRIAALGKRLFNSNEGLELLEYFKSVTLDRPVFSSSVEAGKQATSAAYREGQNDIIRQLITFTLPKKS